MRPPCVEFCQQQADVKSANMIAKHTWELAEWAAKELRAIVTLENPKESYIWLFFATLRASAKQLWEDVVLSQCRFGTSYRKAFSWFPTPLVPTGLLSLVFPSGRF